MIPGRKWSLYKKLIFSFILLIVFFGPVAGLTVMAQQQIISRLFLSGADASSAPTITLRIYGMDGQGTPLNLTPENLNVTHNGQPVNNLAVVGPETVGTFTIFVTDIPPGVESQLPAIQQAIEQFASPPNMQERVDYIAVYQVGETTAIPLLEPTHFYNAVRNFFATPLDVQSGPTALVDSLVGLLNQIETLKPNPNLYTSIVVLTDGTDVVSTQFEDQDVVIRANETQVPIHTVLLNNVNLQQATQDIGQSYLLEVANGSRGVPAVLSDATSVQAVWQRINAFRDHTLVQYAVENLSAGEQQVVLSLRDEPTVQVETSVTVSAAAPSVIINLPPESRELTLSDLETPVQLSFSAAVSWLDGVQRNLTNAELIVNGTVVQSIDINRLNRFSAQISNFTYGQNTVQVAVTDEQGQRATSPPITLTVLEGETSVPDEIQGEGAGSAILRIVVGCFVVLILLVLLALLAVATRRWRLLHRLGLAGLFGRIPFFRRYLEDDVEVQKHGQQPGQAQREFQQYAPDPGEQDWDQPPEYDQPQSWDQPQGWGQPAQGPTPWPAVQQPHRGQSAPYLEVLESVTRMPPIVDLTAVEHRIGRSPSQADIVFENDITVSRLHASVVLEADGYHIYDEGSTSGTWVNEQPVNQQGQTLADGDEIRLGAAVLRFRQP